MPEKIPVLVVGDAPNVTGGLSRIARDITALLYQDSDALGIEVMQAGILYDGSPWPWRVFPLHDEPNWGRGDFERVWSWAAKGRQGVVFSVWDPARCFELKKAKWFRTLPGANLWGYFAIDSVNEQGGFGGPAKEVVEEYDRARLGLRVPAMVTLMPGCLVNSRISGGNMKMVFRKHFDYDAKAASEILFIRIMAEIADI